MLENSDDVEEVAIEPLPHKYLGKQPGYNIVHAKSLYRPQASVVYCCCGRLLQFAVATTVTHNKILEKSLSS